MIWLKQTGWNILTSGFSHFSTVQPITVLEVYVLSGKRTKLHDKRFVYRLTPYHVYRRKLSTWEEYSSTVQVCDLSSLHLFLHHLRVYYELTTLPVVLIAHNILKQCTRIAFCRGFFNLGSFLVTSNGNYYNLMPNAGVWNPINKTTLKKTLGSLGFTGSGKSLNEMLLELFWSKIKPNV